MVYISRYFYIFTSNSLHSLKMLTGFRRSIIKIIRPRLPLQAFDDDIWFHTRMHKKSSEILKKNRFFDRRHPTQVQRKTMLDLTIIFNTRLRQHRDVKAGLVNEKKWLANLRRAISSWWCRLMILGSETMLPMKLTLWNTITPLQAITNLMLELGCLGRRKGIHLKT